MTFEEWAKEHPLWNIRMMPDPRQTRKLAPELPAMKPNYESCYDYAKAAWEAASVMAQASLRHVHDSESSGVESTLQQTDS